MITLLKSARIRWATAGAVLLGVMLVLPLLLFAWLSYWKLGYVSWSYYVPHEEFWQGMRTGELRKIYYAPLLAVNVTSGFLIANMFTYTLGHTLVTALLVVLVLLYVAAGLRRARQCRAPVSAATAGCATAGVFMATAASSSAALTGCHGAGTGGGIVALTGLGSVAGAWMSDAATVAQFLLVVGLAVLLLITSRRKGRAATAGSEHPRGGNADVERDFEPAVAGGHPDLSGARSARFHRSVRSAGAHAELESAPAMENR